MKTFEAICLFSAAKCNLDCSYCYIPKLGAANELDKQIKDYIESDQFIPDLQTATNGDLRHLSFWGAEPTLSFDPIKKRFKELFATFPNLENLQFSTNVTKPDAIVDFVWALVPYSKGRKINLSIQFSFDGPNYITEKNRGISTERILENIKRIIKGVEIIDLKNFRVQTRTKATIPWEILAEFGRDKEKVVEWFDFFENVGKEISTITKGNKTFNMDFAVTNCSTFEGGSEYTVEECKQIGDACKNIVKVKRDNERSRRYFFVEPRIFQYERIFKRLIELGRDLYSKQLMFTCSGGDSSVGLAMGKLSLCQRGFFYDVPKWWKDFQNLNNVKDSDARDKGLITFFLDKYGATLDDKVEFQYKMRSYHDFVKFRIGIGIALITELARSGQVLEIYKDFDKALLLSLFVTSAMSCPVQNIFSTGNIHSSGLNDYKLMGNGAFEAIVSEATR